MIAALALLLSGCVYGPVLSTRPLTQAERWAVEDARAAWRDRLIRHEAVHWLQQCTGRGYRSSDPHGDPEAWCEDGCPGRYRRTQ